VPATNNAVCLQMTLDGLGIACLPRPMIEEHLGAGRLREVAYGWRPDALFFEARCDLDPLPPYIAEAAKIAQRLSPPQDRNL
jgi:DNA-binding transcriptional LysR family regulator